MLTFPWIATVPGLIHGVTQRAGGASVGAWASLNLGRGSGDDADAVTENGRLVAQALGAPSRIRFPRQVHGAHVIVVERDTVPAIGDASVAGDVMPAGPLGDGDAVATNVPGVALGVLGADCPGVLVVDPVRRAIAVVHAGWRGTVAGVLPAAITTLSSRFGSRPDDLRVGVGPGISARRYEVGPDVAEPVRAAIPGGSACLTPGRGDRCYLDLHAALRRQALACGVPASSIESMSLCTFDERDRFFSHRRDGAATGRHALVAMWAAAGSE